MAAGLGNPLWKTNGIKIKGFISFKGIPVVERSIQILIDCGIKRIIIGNGYHKDYNEVFADKYSGIECVFNPCFAEITVLYSMELSRGNRGDCLPAV